MGNFEKAKKIFGERLKEMRKRAGIRTQQEFSELVEKNIKTIQNWEQGVALPEMIDLLNICNMLNCDMDYLFGRINSTTHDLKYISDETGVSEDGIRHIQSFWIKKPGNWCIDSSYKVETPKDIKDYFLRINRGAFAEENYSSEIKKRQQQSEELKTLNLLLCSENFKEILANINAYLFFEYEDTEEEKKKAAEFTAVSKTGKKYTSVIKGKRGFVDSEYLNLSFLIALQNNCIELKKELKEKNIM